MTLFFPEDCQILAQVLAAEIDQAATTKVIDIPKVLEAYGRLRLEEVHAVCTLSNIASMISTRKILVAQLVLTVMLSKTLGRLAPKVSKQSFSSLSGACDHGSICEMSLSDT